MVARGVARQLDRRFDRILRTTRVPGLAVRVSHRGHRVFERLLGYRDRERGLPVTSDTVFGLASITKSVSALAILRLADSGRLSVDDPVVRHLPEFRTPERRWSRQIRLRHLLSHSAGFPPLPGLYRSIARSLRSDPSVHPEEYRRAGIDLSAPPIDTYAQLIDYLGEAEYVPLGPPGSVYSYSNEGYALIGAVIESVSGTTYEEFVDETVLKPGHLDTAGFDPGILQREPAVTELYTRARIGRRSRVLAAPGYWEQSATRASGALRMSLDDLMRYIEVFRTAGRIGDARIVGRQSFRRMIAPQIAVNPFSSYGLGVFLTPDVDGGLWIHHSGGLKGVSSEFAVAPTRGITGALLANLDGFPGGRALRFALNAALGRPLDAARIPLPRRGSSGRSMAEYAGWYGCGEGYWLTVRPIRGALRIDFRGIEVTDRDVRAVPIAPDLFRVGPPSEESFVEFHRDPRGRIVGLRALQRYIRRRSQAAYLRARSGRLVW